MVRAASVIASAALLVGAVTAGTPGAAQDGPVVVVSPPPPLVSAGPAQGSVIDPVDQDLATRGAKAFAPLVSAVSLQFDDVLPDYPSARFKEVSLGYRDGKRIICGLYNAKNRMGAYTGWAIFYAFTGEATRIVILNADESPEYSYRYHCGTMTAWLPGDWSSAVAAKP